MLAMSFHFILPSLFSLFALSFVIVTPPLVFLCYFFFLMIRRPPRSTLDRSSAASDVYKRQSGYCDFMLRRFIYLDASALSQYVTALEGGRTTESTTRHTRVGRRSGGVDAKVINAAGEKSREEEESKTLSDTDEAQFDRLLQAAANDPEELGWVEVMELSLIHISEPTRPY